ncbi:hypothetical protein CHL67_08870 [Prosthecochloris sp. GSB1]|nr:hypothetical protein CHL67_08870 [Prosthecochloris sp. GSB1]
MFLIKIRLNINKMRFRIKFFCFSKALLAAADLRLIDPSAMRYRSLGALSRAVVAPGFVFGRLCARVANGVAGICFQ